MKTIYEDVLPKLGTRIACYGWSMSDQDSHLLRAILSQKDLERVAISVMATGDTAGNIRRFEDRFWPNAVNKKLKLHFFDAASKGCWIHA